MLEKRIPLPFLGKELSAWLYRTNGWLKENPRKAGCFLFATAAGWVWYENNVTNRDKVVSPTVNNHLVYDVKHVKGEDFERSPADRTNEEILRSLDAQRREQQLLSSSSSTTTAEQKADLQEVMTRENAKDRGTGQSAMVVKSGQLYVREPHWNIRNNERNWAIMGRDQQQQKDHFWYRIDRSRDDDYARNTYSK